MIQKNADKKYPNLTIEDMIEIASGTMNKGNYEGAYRDLAHLTPDEVGAEIYAEHEAYIEWMRFICADQLKMKAQAFKHIARAYECDPQNADYANEYAFLLGQKKPAPLEQIIEICDSGLQDPHEDEITKTKIECLTLYKAASLYRLGLYDDVIQLFEKTNIQIQDNKNSQNEMLGYCYLRRGHYAPALASFSFFQSPRVPSFSSLAALCANALSFSPTSNYQHAKEGHYTSGDIMFHLDLLTKVIEDGKYQVALDHVDFLISVTKTNNASYIDLLRTKAMCHRELGDRDIAEEILTRILPRAFQEPTRYFTVFTTVARQQYQQGNFADAIAHETLALEMCKRRNFSLGALHYARAMFKAASESGYPVLAGICERNAGALQFAIDNKSPFPELEELRLE